MNERGKSWPVAEPGQTNRARGWGLATGGKA